MGLYHECSGVLRALTLAQLGFAVQLDYARLPDRVLRVGEPFNERQIESQSDELLRLATSIRQEAVTASLVLRKLASYPRQNRLAWGLRELGRIDRTLFTLDWLQSPELRRRVAVA